MIGMEMTKIAAAAGVLAPAPHRPPLEHISPTAAATRAAAEVDDAPFTVRDLAGVAASLLVVWAFIVCTWALWGGAA